MLADVLNGLLLVGVIVALVVVSVGVEVLAAMLAVRRANQVSRDVRRQWVARDQLDKPCPVCGAERGQWCTGDGVHV